MKTHINKIICSILGHRGDCTFEYRIRRNNGNWWSRKGGKKRVEYRFVLGEYIKCSRCGKKLTNFKRV